MRIASQIDRPDRRCYRPTRRAARAGAEEGVDDPIGSGERRRPRFQRRRLERLDRDPGPHGDGVIDRGVAPVRSRITGEEEFYFRPEVLQVTGDHEAIAAVVPPAAGNRHPERRIDGIE